MTDLITTILTTAVEHAPGTTAVVAAYKVAQPFLAKILGPGADEIGEIGRDYIKGRRAKNVERTLVDADKLLGEAGREPQEVPLSITVPLLEAASLQDEPSLTEKWAALLANAADPMQRAVVQPAFVEVLRQLSPMDAQVVLALYRAAEHASGTEGQHMIMSEGLMSRVGTSEQNMRLSLDNLLRLQLCKPVITYGGYSAESFQMPTALLMTTFGLRFTQAVTSPAP